MVLLVVMNWFFHRLYWTGWISHHNRRRRRLIADGGSGLRIGLIVLGFTAVYREGFEIVIFLQNLRLTSGTSAVLEGTGVGLALTALVGVATFFLHHKLPYKKMLVLTGVLLGFVLIVMVGESAQELQLAGWIPTTGIGVSFPGFLGLWFAIFPTVEGARGAGNRDRRGRRLVLRRGALSACASRAPAASRSRSGRIAPPVVAS